MGFSGGKLRPYIQRPYSDKLDDTTNQFLDWVQTTLNTLVGQKLSTTGVGFTGLQNPIINPQTQVSSGGGRTSAVSTPAKFTTSSGSVLFSWDGTDMALGPPFVLRRDNGTSTTPLPGSQAISGLTNGSTYHFYPYWDELSSTIKFAFITGAFVGTPAIALLDSNPNLVTLDQQARQICIAANHIPLWTLSVNAGVGSSGPPTMTVNSGATKVIYTRSGSGY